MYHEYAGTGEFKNKQGRRNLHNFGRCTSLDKLANHLDEWSSLLNEYGTELLVDPIHATSTLRTMVCDLLPDDLENQLDDKPEL